MERLTCECIGASGSPPAPAGIEAHPKFHDSVKKIFCHSIFVSVRRAEMFYNFRVSCRGSIRRPPNVLTWVHSLEMLLKEHGETDAASVVRLWNAQASENNQLVGSKSVAVRLVIGMPESAKHELYSYVAAVSWDNCPWSEDSLGSKKLYPSDKSVGKGAKTPKGWPERLSVSEESLVLMIKHVQANHAKFRSLGGCAPKKDTRQTVEEVALMSAFVINVVVEVQALMPLASDKIKVSWIDKFAEGDSRVSTEVMMAVAERSSSFTCRCIATLCEMMDQHTKDAPHGASLSVEASRLEDSLWDLQLNQMKHDFQQFRVFRRRLDNFFSGVEHIKLEWRKKAFDQNNKACARGAS